MGHGLSRRRSTRAPRSGPTPPTGSGAIAAVPASWASRSWRASATSATWWPTIWTSPTTAPSSSSSRPNAAAENWMPLTDGRLVAGRPAVLLRLGRRAAGRRCRSSAWPSRPRRPRPRPSAEERTGPPARRPGPLRRGQRALLAGHRGDGPGAGRERLPPAGGALGHRRRPPRTSGVGLLGPGRRRGPRHRGDAAAGPLLERLASATNGGRPSTTPGTSRRLNGHQAVLDDGVFRAVVAHRDPGVANWLDTAGNRRGPA